MTGIGFGIARETNRTWLKWVAPIGGYCTAMFLHCDVEHGVDHQRVPLPAHAAAVVLFVLAFIGILIWLVVRKGRSSEPPAGRGAARDHHEEELDLVCHRSAAARDFGWGGGAGRRS